MKPWQEVLYKIDSGKHAVQYYTDEWFLARIIGFYANAGLLKNENTVLICSKHHLELFGKAILETSGRAPSELKKEGKLLILDAEETLSLFMVNGFPDKLKFKQVIGDVLKKMSGSGPLRAYGEMVDILWQKGRREAAVQLENLWNELLKTENFFLLCAYSVDTLSPDTYDGHFDRACHSHDTILPAEDTQKFHEAVHTGLANVLGAPLSSMVTTLATLEDCRKTVPDTQKYLLWLSKHLPLTAKKVLSVSAGPHVLESARV